MRDIMAPEVAAGTITAAELDALTGHRKERRAAVKTRPEGSHAGARSTYCAPRATSRRTSREATRRRSNTRARRSHACAARRSARMMQLALVVALATGAQVIAALTGLPQIVRC